MISREIWMLAGTAATLGLVHTVIGPDHYLPFIVIGRARNWTLRKTLLVSFFAGLGHILSSVVLGFVGIALGLAVAKLQGVESARGGIAAWLLIGFGFAYFVWGMRWAWRGKPHVHPHLHDHEDAQVHPHGPDEGPHDPDHEHVHQHAHTHTHELAEHAHPHGEVPKKTNITPWVLFTIFVFGPCEPLIPLVMYPAARHSTAGVVLVAAAFGVVTVATMLIIIALASYGASFVKLGRLERYSHALAGLMIFISGLAVQFLGL
ncbi:MAG TPA: sulfite exporter TauE/SafE family protein [Acidobacteriota bacterium]|nr:sulfite exporter TauE/SafE family protein [Acidobacteriota bacterium]